MNAVELKLFASRIAAICDEMGVVLRRAAFSPNIKDRLDFSCALFEQDGQLIGQAAHIPVHLGSMAFAMGDLAPVSQARFEPHSRLTVYLAHPGFTDSDHLANLLKVQLLVIIKSKDQFLTLRQPINGP